MSKILFILDASPASLAIVPVAKSAILFKSRGSVEGRPFKLGVIIDTVGSCPSIPGTLLKDAPSKGPLLTL